MIFMETFFALILFLMLILVGYAKAQQGVVKTTGGIVFVEDED